MSRSPTLPTGLRRVGTAARSGVQEYRRTPVLLALLGFLPAYVIAVFAVVAPDSPAVLQLPGGETAQVTLPVAFAAMMTPLVGALLGGIAGLFLIRTARAADARLVVAGYRPVEVVVARFALLVAVGLVATAVSMAVAVLVTDFDPASPLWFAAGTLLASLTYGSVGVLAGVFLSRLAGVYLLLFGAMIDLFLYANPLATDAPWYAAYTPGHLPMDLAMAGGFGSVDVGLVGWSLVALLGTLAVATGAFYRAVRP